MSLLDYAYEDTFAALEDSFAALDANGLFT
jgi:hypothetical protein